MHRSQQVILCQMAKTFALIVYIKLLLTLSEYVPIKYIEFENVILNSILVNKKKKLPQIFPRSLIIKSKYAK